MQRRSFLSGFSAALAFLGVTTPVGAGEWRAARHAQDEWFDKLPGRHRVFFDTWTASKFEEALGFAGNYFRANRSDYGLDDDDLAVIVCARHRTGPFAFNDAIWAKYGRIFSERQQFTDPKTKDAPVANVFGPRLAQLVKQGVHLAVCNLTTRAYSQIIAEQHGTTADAVYKELTTNTVGNAHFVPAGIVAVTRAQEYGYAIVSVG